VAPRAACEAAPVTTALEERDDPAAPREQGPFIEPHLETVRWHGHEIRVPPLSAAARHMGSG
jgi:hypothetical protein